MTQFSNRIDNFCAGPCTLPLPVLQQAQAELLNFQNSGMSLMEISHRSKLFEPLHYQTLELAQTLINAPRQLHPPTPYRRCQPTICHERTKPPPPW